MGGWMDGCARLTLAVCHAGCTGRGQGRTEEWRQKLAEQLAPEFERVQLLWLLANTQHEQTAIAFKAAGHTTGAGAAANGAAVEAAANRLAQ